MGAIREAVAALAEKLGLTDRLLRRARRRTASFRERAAREHRRQIDGQTAADLFRTEGDEAAAAKNDRKAARCAHRAYRSHLKAIYWRGRIKVLVQRREGLRRTQAELDAELAEAIAAAKATLRGNRATGGTARERWRLVCLASVANCSNGKRRNFYSMSGAWDIDHVVVPGEEYGERSDCSSTVTGWAKAAGLPDPNGEDFHGGYTGTLVGEHNRWHKVSVTELRKKGWGYVVYGGGTGHHVEAYIGPGDRTAGHGSPPVDFGVIDLFGDADYRCYVYR
jgi:hypothetical protein